MTVQRLLYLLALLLGLWLIWPLFSPTPRAPSSSGDLVTQPDRCAERFPGELGEEVLRLGVLKNLERSRLLSERWRDLVVDGAAELVQRVDLLLGVLR